MVTAATPSTASLRAEAATMPGPSLEAERALAERAGSVLRPPGALARLDDLAAWIAGWSGKAKPVVERPAVLVFAGDHGVAADGVSAFPSDITAAMLRAVETGQATVNAMATSVGATVRVIDVGVGEPTANLRVEAAMSAERFANAFSAGRDAVATCDTDLIVVGELGIGNTTAAAAVSAALIGGHVDRFVGRGTGVDDVAFAHKTTVVADAVARIASVSDPLEILREVGGTELAAMAGAMVEARARSVPLLLDGYIATAPALALAAVDRSLVAHARAAHRSAEPGHQLALDALGLDALLDLDMRLGEGTGAVAAIPLVRAACAAVSNVATFDEFFADTGLDETSA